MAAASSSWDDAKAASNLRDHGVSFAQAAAACRDPFAVEWIDDREAYGEERVILLGMKDGQILAVVYDGTEHADSDHLGAQGHEDMSRTSTFARMRRDGSLVRLQPGRYRGQHCRSSRLRR